MCCIVSACSNLLRGPPFPSPRQLETVTILETDVVGDDVMFQALSIGHAPREEVGSADAGGGEHGNGAGRLVTALALLGFAHEPSETAEPGPFSVPLKGVSKRGP